MRPVTMGYKPIRMKSGHPTKPIYVPNEDNLLPYCRYNDILSDTTVLMS